MRKKRIYIVPEKRYGKQGYSFDYRYLEHAFGSYSTKGWVDKAGFKKLYPKEKFDIIKVKKLW